MNKQLLRFGVVGIVGFLVDAGVVVTLVKFVSVPPLLARVSSFLVAASVTFVFNQRFTFQFSGHFSFVLWVSYLTTTAVGACINIGIYHLWLAYAGKSIVELVIGTAIGSITAMFVNYFASSALVFRPANRRLVS